MKFFAILLSFSLVGTVFAASPVTAFRITDIPTDHWVEGYATYLAEQGFMKLSDSGEFLPDRPVSRGEMVDIIMRQIGVQLEVPKDATFNDLAPDHEFFSEVETAYKLGIVRGFSNGDGTLLFRPDDFVTRAQFVKIILEANDIDIPEAISRPDFPDVPISSWESVYVRKARELGFINGYADGNFGPQDNMTRAQVAKVVYLFLALTDQIVKDTMVKSSGAVVDETDGINAYENLVFSLVNASRNEFDKKPLILDGDISRVARMHASFLAENNIKSSHVGDGGSTPFDRLHSADIDYAAAAENVGWSSANVQDISAALISIHSDPTSGMMADPVDRVSHSTNILGTFYDFDRMGIGVVVKDQGGSREVWVVEMFVESR